MSRVSVVVSLFVCLGVGCTSAPPKPVLPGASGGAGGGGAGGTGGAAPVAGTRGTRGGGSGGTGGNGGIGGTGGTTVVATDAGETDDASTPDAERAPDGGQGQGDATPADASGEAKAAPRCGDGEKNQPEEECDDGAKNVAGTYGKKGQCSKDCKNVDFCGDKAANPPQEECDNGDLNGKTPPPGVPFCSAACKMASCGDGTVDPGEECDAGNKNIAGPHGNKGECTKQCHRATFCGDKMPDPPFEECDNGDTNGKNPAAGQQPCAADCKRPICGNGKPEPGEQCDNGNKNVPGTHGNKGDCTQRCQNADFCGDKTVNPPFEECDNGALNGKAPPPGQPACDINCKKSTCGNGQVEGSEECDDGLSNTGNNDTYSATPPTPPAKTLCNAQCRKVRFCGDGKLDRADGETCEPSMVAPGTVCILCRLTFTPPPLPEPRTLPVTDIHVDNQAVCGNPNCEAAKTAANSEGADTPPLKIGCTTPDAESFGSPTFILFDKPADKELASDPPTKLTVTFDGAAAADVICFVDNKSSIPVPGTSPFTLPRECLGRDKQVKVGIVNKAAAPGSCLTLKHIQLDTQVVSAVRVPENLR